jgi:spore coat polysaccharide biosynthesis protein SpsF (cytidylyltransferase family)
MPSGIIIQARLTGKRFPNKIFAELGGKKVIDHLIDGISKIKGTERIFAIPNTPSNDMLYVYLIAKGEKVFRGLENDVLDRYYRCAEKFNIDPIIRICADTPFINAKYVLERLQSFYMREKEFTYGDGCWIFTFADLVDAWTTQGDAESREHVVRSMFNSVDYDQDIPRLEKKILKNTI